MELEYREYCQLSTGQSYKGWGYCQNGYFIPHGCGKKYYTDYYAYGNFQNGELNGPAIISHYFYMYTMHFKNNRGNGWGMCINSGKLIEFGYYENSRLKVDLSDFVLWYCDKMMNSGRTNENMLHMYTLKESKSVSELFIGYKGHDIWASMGFRFKADGSVWVGTTRRSLLSGKLIHFCPNGIVDAGIFNNKNLTQRLSLQNIIDEYYGTYNDNHEDDLMQYLMCSPEFAELMKPTLMGRLHLKREKYKNVREIIPNYNYFTPDDTVF